MSEYKIQRIEKITVIVHADSADEALEMAANDDCVYVVSRVSDPFNDEIISVSEGTRDIRESRY